MTPITPEQFSRWKQVIDAAKQTHDSLKRVLGPSATDQFHNHLDVCQQCANQPFNMCPVGVDLLHKAVESI